MARSRRRRANGEGSLYQTKSGLWRGAISYTDPETGTAKRSFVAHRSQSVARERLTALRRQLDLGYVPVDGSVTVGDYLDKWLETLRQRVKPSTWRGHDLAVRLYLKPTLGSQRVSRLTPTDVERVLARLQKKGHGATARNARATLRQALNAAVRDGVATRNAAALATPPRAAPKEMKVLTETEVRTLLRRTLPYDERSRRLRAYLLAVAAGADPLMAWMTALDFTPETIRDVHFLIDVENAEDARLLGLIQRGAHPAERIVRLTPDGWRAG